MKKWLSLAVIMGILLLGVSETQAAPLTGYGQLIKNLDAIQKEAVLPVAEEVLMTGYDKSGVSGQAAQVVLGAKSLLGAPVVWGGAYPAEGFDCSGLVQYVFRQAGISLPRTADLQFMVGKTVSPARLQPGDLVYFTTYEPGASHVGIYIGGNKFIHTSYFQKVVAVADMTDNYFVQRYYGAKRVF